MLTAREDGDIRATASYAAMAAPYIHPRLASDTANHTASGSISLISEFPEWVG